MAAVASQMMLQCVFDGSISIHDMEVERRPYHKNCGCALHNLKDICSKACPQKTYVSVTKKRSWTNCSMYTTASKFSSQSFLSKNQDNDKQGGWLWTEERGLGSVELIVLLLLVMVKSRSKCMSSFL